MEDDKQTPITPPTDTNPPSLLQQPRISVKCEMRKERIMCDQASAAERSDFRHVARGIRERMTDKLSIYVLLFIY